MARRLQDGGQHFYLNGVRIHVSGDPTSDYVSQMVHNAMIDLQKLKDRSDPSLEIINYDRAPFYNVRRCFGQDEVFIYPFYEEKKRGGVLISEREEIKKERNEYYILALEAWDPVDDIQIGYVLCPDGFGGPKYELLVTDNVVRPIPDDIRDWMGYPRYHFEPGEWAAWYAAKQAENPKLTVYPFCYPNWKGYCRFYDEYDYDGYPTPDGGYVWGPGIGQIIYRDPHPFTWRPYTEEDMATGVLPEKLVHSGYDGRTEINYFDISNPMEICEIGHVANADIDSQVGSCCVNSTAEAVLCLTAPSLFGLHVIWFELGYEGGCSSACGLIKLSEHPIVYHRTYFVIAGIGLGKDSNLYAIPYSIFDFEGTIIEAGLIINGYYFVMSGTPIGISYPYIRWFKTGDNSYILVVYRTGRYSGGTDFYAFQIFDVINSIPTLRNETIFSDVGENIIRTFCEGYPCAEYTTFNLPITSVIAGEFEGESVRCPGHFRLFRVVEETEPKTTKFSTETILEE